MLGIEPRPAQILERIVGHRLRIDEAAEAPRHRRLWQRRRPVLQRRRRLRHGRTRSRHHMRLRRPHVPRRGFLERRADVPGSTRRRSRGGLGLGPERGFGLGLALLDETIVAGANRRGQGG